MTTPNINNHNQDEKQLSLDKYGFYIRKTIFQSNSMPSYHSHDCFEILYVVEGIREILFNGSSCFQLDFNNIVIINPHAIHRVCSVSSGLQSTIVLYLEPNFINEISDFFSFDITSCFTHPIIKLPFYAQKQISEYFSKLLFLEKNDPNYYFEYRFLIINILYLLYQATVDSNKKTTVVSISSKKQHVDSIIKYIDENYYKQLTISELSNVFHFSKTHLNRLFKELMNITLHQYLISIRIVNAKKLLDKQIPLSKVWCICGFNSAEDFSRTFKKHIGCSPSEYVFKKNQGC